MAGKGQAIDDRFDFSIAKSGGVVIVGVKEFAGEIVPTSLVLIGDEGPTVPPVFVAPETPSGAAAIEPGMDDS